LPLEHNIDYQELTTVNFSFWRNRVQELYCS